MTTINFLMQNLLFRLLYYYFSTSKNTNSAIPTLARYDVMKMLFGSDCTVRRDETRKCRKQYRRSPTIAFITSHHITWRKRKHASRATVSEK